MIDSESQIIYVFGGKVVDGEKLPIKYSGFYSYNISTSKWKNLQYVRISRVDWVADNPTDQILRHCKRYPSDLVHKTISRSFQRTDFQLGHSMLFEPFSKSIFIFAGQREDKYLADLWIYDTQSSMAIEAWSDFSSSGGPDACFTQRSVINTDAKEVYM